ncbi:MAG TPA: hypothetical protein DET40_04060 [Lentisphaeria bacterium]|nr:MAG: hypothetical protein A2X45_01880 [Lentisphaerae bacterium GWF2_50_93]HCE42701.1 hypothetical protein [Lentisphaeria bacterium]
MNSQDIKRIAKSFGADEVGIGNIERWEGAPLQMDPRQIMPECRSVIGMTFRVMRGSLRGIEEGTFFSNYPAMGYGGLTYLYIPMTVINICKQIEDEGYEAIPIGHQSDWRAIGNEGEPRKNYSVPVAEGRAAPDVMIQLRIAAYLCGLGEIGFSKMFLSPKLGPRQRVGIILTELDLEPDPIYNGPKLCNRCLACVKACPGKAFDPKKTVKVNLAGKEVEWMDIDCKACDLAFRGGEVADHPLSQEEEYMEPMQGKQIQRGSNTPFYKKPRNLYNTGQAVCGARGCSRACMMSLEARKVITNQFKKPFRRRPEWSVDWNNVDGNPQVPKPGARVAHEAD